ncbi:MULTISPECIES: nuclear transport factor 2 family protein [unclassified Arthrobacter]|uniref:nuclear transport factor 2 family protein n=1 Tax=unclassified Arthrobacter TaxID=235627 RepID=UPI002883358B|nr:MULTISPECIES: nuclear transport factor 2 family protein [unclassified Arthrobacter]
MTQTDSMVSRRLAALENREAARLTLSRYMDLCDVPREKATTAQDLAEIFTDDAVWEGTGPEYGRKFGSVKGRPAIIAMLMSYLPPARHFTTNIHVLGEASIHSENDHHATGFWMMQQISEYCDGQREIVAARLTVDFTLVRGIARINHFRTQKLLTQALGTRTHLPTNHNLISN